MNNVTYYSSLEINNFKKDSPKEMDSAVKIKNWTYSHFLTVYIDIYIYY